MSSQLASQLKKIQVVNASTRDFSSILFGEKEASSYTTEAIHSIGRNGIMELVRIDGSFARFEETLFGPKMSMTNRMQLTKRENEDISNQIREYLFAVSPYMLLKCVQKTVEYLIRRFSIHTFDAEEFLLAVLPFHESPLFPRVVKLLRFSSPLFDFLEGVKSSGTTMIRASISKKCMKDPAFLEFILNGIRRMNQMDVVPVVHLTLVCGIIVDISRSNQFTEQIIRSLISFASIGFTSANTEFQATSYFILSHIAINVVLEEQVINACMSQLMKVERINMMQVMECLLLLLRNNIEYRMPISIVKSFVFHSLFSTTLRSLGEKVSVFPIFAAIASSLQTIALTDPEALNVLSLLLENVREENRKQAGIIALQALHAYCSTHSLTKPERNNMEKILLALSSGLDEVFDQLLSDLDSSSMVKEIASALFNGSSHMVLQNGRTLYMSVMDHTYSVRKEICELLLKQLNNWDEHESEKECLFVKSSLLSLLEDDFMDITIHILSQPIATLLNVFNKDELVELAMVVLKHEKVYSFVDQEDVTNVILSCLNILKQIDIMVFLQEKETCIWMKSVCLLYYYLINTKCDKRIREDCVDILISMPYPCIPEEKMDCKGELSGIVNSVSKKISNWVNTSTDNTFIASLPTMMSTFSSVAVFFSQVLLSSIQSIVSIPIKQQIACILVRYANMVLDDIPAEGMTCSEEEIVKLSISELCSFSCSTEREIMQYELSLCYQCALSSGLHWNTDDSVSYMQDSMQLEAHPIAVISHAFLSFSPQKSFYGALANAVIVGNWPEKRYLPCTSMLSCITQQPIVLHSFNYIASYLSSQASISSEVSIVILMATLHFWNHPVAAIRVMVMQVMDTLKEKTEVVQSRTKKTSKKNTHSAASMGDESEIPREEIARRLLMLVSSLLQYRSDIREDPKLFTIKLNLLLRNASMEVAIDNLAAAVLSTVLQLPSIQQKNTYLNMFALLPYTPYVERLVLSNCSELYRLFEEYSQKKEKIPTGYCEVWKRMLVLFFKAMAQTTAYQKEYKAILDRCMSNNLSVETENALPFSPLSDVLQSINNDLFSSMNATERVSLIHSLICIVPSNTSIDATMVYSTINALDVSLLLFAEEAKTLVAMPIATEEEERECIQMITAFVEVMTRNSKFNYDVQIIDPLLLLLKQLKRIVVNRRAMEIESKEEVVMQDDLMVHYPIQLIVESMLYILKDNTSNVKVITGTQTLQSNDRSQPSSKRMRRNSISIQTDIGIEPQLIVDIIDLNLTTQIKKTCLQLLSVLSSLHNDVIDKHLFSCFEELARRVIRAKDEEAHNIILNVITYCLPKIKGEDKILSVYKTFLSCIPYLSYEQSVYLLNSILSSSSILYIGHITAYLLLITNGFHLSEKEWEIAQEDVKATTGVLQFVMTVFLNISVQSQIQALSVLCTCAQYVTDSTRNKNSITVPSSKSKIQYLTYVLLQSIPIQDWCKEEETVIRIAKIIVTFVKDVVSNTQFVTKATTAKEDVIEKIQPFFINVIENLLMVLQNCFVSIETIGAQDDANSRDWIRQYKELESDLYDTITVCNEVLSIRSLLTVLSVLMKHEDSSIRKRALIMLNKKIEDNVNTFTEEEKKYLVDFLANLCSICNDEEEQSVNKQTAVLSIHILAQYFGKEYINSFIPCVQTIIHIISNPDNARDTQALKGSAYVALSMLCSQLGMRILPFLPKFFPFLLSELDVLSSNMMDMTQKSSEEREECYILAQSLLSSLHSIVMYQGALLSSYLVQILTIIVAPSLYSCEKQPIRGAVNLLFDVMSDKMEARLLLPAVIDSYKKIDSYAAPSICGLFTVVKYIFDKIDIANAESVYVSAWSFCIVGLETRGRWMNSAMGGMHEAIDEIEETVVAAMLAITLKLNEVQLSPLFIKTVSWMEEKSVMEKSSEEKDVAEQTLPPIMKAIPFFTLICGMSNTFKSIFTSYYSQFFDIMIGFMLVFSKTCKKEKMNERKEEQMKLYKLVKLIVLSLYRCFLFDMNYWMDEEKFKAISTPLIKLMGAYFIPNYQQDYVKFMSSYVIPTLLQLILCTAGHGDWWKQFNHEVLLQTHHPIASVKLTAIRVLRECFERVSQEYLILLPDVVPYLAELLEDEDAIVEKAAQDLRKQLEAVSGEELSSFLTM